MSEITSFVSGAIRDTTLGKSALELIPLEMIPDKVMVKLNDNPRDDLDRLYSTDERNRMICDIFTNLKELRLGNTNVIDDLIYLSFEIIGKNYLDILYDLGIHYGAGAEKYGANNYMLGQKLSHIVGSYERHLIKYIQGWKDEAPHERGMLWNVLNIKFVIEYYKNDKEICDMLYWYKDRKPNIDFLKGKK